MDGKFKASLSNLARCCLKKRGGGVGVGEVEQWYNNPGIILQVGKGGEI